MELLSREHLENSPVVANNRMNRERNAVGVNSYQRDISLSPIEFLAPLARNTTDEIRWLDVCCGEAKALIQTAQHLNAHLPNHRIQITGIDLVAMHHTIPSDIGSITLLTQSFFDFNTDLKFDLITCVHGLHYLGDKLAAIQKACSLLTARGTFIANLDINNLKNPADKDFHKTISTWLRDNNLAYNSRKHLLHVTGNKSLNVPFKYLGADDNAGPNYTGQEVVDSYYQ